MNVIFTCGGTGGHINPAIAVANILKEKDPGANILFIGGAGGMEEELVAKAGYRLVGLKASGLTRGLSPRALVHNVKTAGQIVSALFACRKIIRQFRPDVILGTGGYASFPALFVGSLMGVPTCVHEANAVPGLATRLAAGRAERILVCFEESRDHYSCGEKVEAVGMPVRREFVYTDKAQARRELGLDDRPLVVSAFGSLGAREMNKIMARFMKLEQDHGMPWQHIHATGSYGWRWMPEHIRREGVEMERCPGLDMREYIYNMPTLMAAADLVISRAGASSCSEIAASGTPCILIPSPNVTNNHQERNARVLADRGGCVMIRESECTPQGLYAQAESLLSDPERCAGMRKALLAWSVPNSAEQICDKIIKLSRG